MMMTENFRELSEKLGGFNVEALNSFFYWNNPFALKHWTMNVVELVMCLGAVLAFIHALRIYRRINDPTFLCYWIISIGYLFVGEIPLYFPQLVGGDPNALRFLHNEFTAGIIYDRMPVYIIALYPALMYPAYVFIERTGIFERKWGLLLGAISAGFVHHCFYEVFDHFGPQFGWWVWNYDLFGATVASVPLASVYTFAFLVPVGLTLATRLLVTRYAQRRKAAAKSINGWHLAALCVLGSFAVFFILVIFTPDLYYQIFLRAIPAPPIEKLVSFSILGFAAVTTLFVISKANPEFSVSYKADGPGSRRYPVAFFGVYLAVFAALWMCALPEYMAASGGITARGTPIGSLSYAVGCYVLCLFWLYLHTARIPAVSSGIKMTASVG